VADYGTDISTLPDLDPTFALISGVDVERESIVRELSTPAGGLFWATEYGFDVRGLVDSSLSDADAKALQLAIQRRLLKREKITKAAATVTFNSPAQKLTISISCVGALGPFSTVFELDSTGVAKLIQ
jgi:phage baseplate assembly protein W